MKIYFFTLLLMPAVLPAQDCPVNAGFDRIICKGSSADIGDPFTSPGYNYSWSPAKEYYRPGHSCHI
jgi:hypothetical protein